MTDTAPKKTQARRIPTWVIVLGLTLLATALHLWRLEQKSIWWDESLSLVRARDDIMAILRGRLALPGIETTDQHPPLYFVLLKLFLLAWGESDAMLRMPSVLCASAIVPLLYVLGAEIASALRSHSPRRIGVLAATLGTLSPFYLWYAQEARMYTLVTLIGLAAAICLWRAVARRSWRWATGFALLSGLGIATHLLYPLVMVGQLLLALPLLIRKRRHILATMWSNKHQRAALILGAAGIVAIAVAIASIVMRHLAPTTYWLKYVPLHLILRDAIHSYSLGLTASLAETWPLTALGFTVYLSGIARCLTRSSVRAKARGSRRRAKRRSDRAIANADHQVALLMVGYALLPPLGLWAYSLFGSIYMGSRYVIMGSPGFYLGIAVGIDWLFGEIEHPLWRKGLGVLLLVTIIGGMVNSDARYFCHPRYATKEDHRGTAEYISARQRPGDLIVVTAPENIPAFEHYYEPLGGSRGETTVVAMPGETLNPNYTALQVSLDLQAAVKGYDRVWLAHCRTQHSDPNDYVRAWLHDNAWRLDQEGFPSWGSSPLVELFRIPPQRQPDAIPANNPLLTLGNALALENVTIYGRQAGAAVAAGQQASPTSGVLGLGWDGPLDAGAYITGDMVWTTLQDVDDLKVALTLRDERGIVWKQNDGRLLRYTFSEAYDAHTRILQDLRFQLPAGLPESTYTLDMLVYQAATGEMLERDNHQGFGHPYIVTLASLDVQRTTPATWDDLASDGLDRLASRPTFGPTTLVAATYGPERIQPGESINLALVWQAQVASETDAVMLINWVDAQGDVLTGDSFPLAGLNDPRSQWRDGELVRGLVTLPTQADAPAGEYTLHLLVHNPDENAFYWRRWLGVLPTSRDQVLGTMTIE